MRNIILLLSLLIPAVAFSQTPFYTESFGTCNSGCSAIGYSGTGGAWTQTITGSEGQSANVWYVSCQENGFLPGNCGATCTVGPSSTGASLHIGAASGSGGDMGASYFESGFCGALPSLCATTNRRIESPAINCTGRSSITLSFNYLAEGTPGSDYAELVYNSGSGWQSLAVLSATNNTNCSPQGQWTAYSTTLPAACNNNANVRIGFRWVNLDDGVATDPSFAVDEVKLSVSGGNPPTAAISASATSACTNQAVTFSDQSTGSPTSWSWTFPGGTPASSTSQNPGSVTWSSGGNFTVTLIATNANGSNTTSVNISVSAPPMIGANGPFGFVCPGVNSNLTASGASYFTWSPGGMNGSPVTVNPTQTTTYTVTGYNIPGCTTTTTVTVNVHPVSSYSFTGLANDYCVNAPAVTLSGSPANGSFSGPGISGNQFTPSVANSGTHTITYTASDANGCTGSTSRTVTVHALPTLSIIGLSANQCLPSSTVSLTGNPAGGSFSGNGMTGNVFDPTAAGVGTHVITYSYTDGFGCANSTSQSTTVDNSPSPTISGLDVFYCRNAFSVTLSGSPANGTFSGPGMTGNVFSPGNAGVGNHTIRYTATAVNGCTGAASQSVTVAPNPSATLNLTPDTICTNSTPVSVSGGSPSGGMYSGPGMTGNTFDPAAVSNAPGAYMITYTLTDASGCKGMDSSALVMEVCAGVSQPASAGLEVYPNPFRQSFTVIVDGNTFIRLTDLQGKVIREAELQPGRNEIVTDGLSPGIYLMGAKSAGGEKWIRLVRE